MTTSHPIDRLTAAEHQRWREQQPASYARAYPPEPEQPELFPSEPEQGELFPSEHGDQSVRDPN